MSKQKTWHSIEIPMLAQSVRQEYAPRHLADLLCGMGISYWCARKWAQQPDRFPGWLEACEGIPRPYRHELDALRYVNNSSVAAVKARTAELIEAGRAKPDALHTAVDEIIGAARVTGEARRKDRRIAKYGHDPVPEVRRTKEERAAIKPKRAEYAKRKVAANKWWRRGRNRKQQKAHIQTRPGGPNNQTLRQATLAALERRRLGRVETAFVKTFGVTNSDWPVKT